jgi:hypothetical protein
MNYIKIIIAWVLASCAIVSALRAVIRFFRKGDHMYD